MRTAKLRCLLALLAFGTLSAPIAAAAPKQVLPIHTGWTFRLSPDSELNHAPGLVSKVTEAELSVVHNWLPAEVPGVVQTDLLRNKVIPDPFYRDNEARLQWIGLEDWEYRTTFDVAPALLRRDHLELVFKGLDTYATVFINDQGVLRADNMFREWRVDAKQYLKTGANSLRVLFRSPIQEVMKRIQHDPYRLVTVTQIQIIAELGIPTDPYTRKAPYQYGWDWGPRFVTEGIWKPVQLEAWDDAVIRDFHIRQNEVTAKDANLSADLEVVAGADVRATVAVSYEEFGAKIAQRKIERNVILHEGLNRIELPIEIVDPARWYPAGYGPQSMYRFHAALRVNGAAADQADVRTGLRSIELRRHPDEWGTSFEFVVNGIPVFAKGANVIPFDSFPTRVTTAQYRQILESARAANMNMIRSWGGGYYESDEFFDICDELGLMVWQDFMFGGGMYPGDADFLANVRQEAIEQVKRLRNHPSLVLWCGNNEVEAAWFYWGERRDWKKSLPPELQERVWQDYLALFNGILPAVIAEYGRPTEYWPSSPSANLEYLPGTDRAGDMHYWDVWHGRAPLEDYRRQFPRFMTEYGFQSFPEMRTVKSFSVPEDWDITTPVMLAHQKNVGGNARIHDYMLRYYGEPKDFASFLYVSQVLQAEAIKIGAEHLRRQRPRTMGSLYWQLNDCWPVASWSSIDYYGRWKALHYYARRFYNDLLVSPNEDEGAVSVYIVSDRVMPTAGKLRVRLMDFTGKVLNENTSDVQIPALSSKVYLQLPTPRLLEGQLPDHVFLNTELLVGGKRLSSNLYFFRRMNEIVLPKPEIKASLEAAGQSVRVRLDSPVLARNVYVSFGDVDATVSENYFDLVPNDPVEIEVKSKAPLEQLRTAMKVISLADALTPNSH